MAISNQVVTLGLIVVVAVASPLVELTSSSTSVAAIGAAGKNVALHRACKPTPACLALIDGSLNLSTRLFNGSRGLNSSRGFAFRRPNGTTLKAGDTALFTLADLEKAFSSLSSVSKPFISWLGRATMVSHIVIYFTSTSLLHDVHRKLMILTWNEERSRRMQDPPVPTEPSTVDEFGPPDASWAIDPSKHLSVSGADGSVSLHVLIHVQRQVAIVAVHWEGQEVRADRRIRGAAEASGLQITEVAVVSTSDVASLDMAGTAEPMIRTEAVASKVPMDDMKSMFRPSFHSIDEASPTPSATELSAFTTSVNVHVQNKADDLDQINASSFVGAVYSALDTYIHDGGHPMEVSKTTLAPDDPFLETPPEAFAHLQSEYGFLRPTIVLGADAAPTRLSSVANAASVYLGGVPLLAWLGLLAVGAMFFPKLCKVKERLGFDDDEFRILGINFGSFESYSYDRLPDQAETEAPLVVTDAEDRANDTASWWLQSDAETVDSAGPVAVGQAQVFHIGSPRGPQRLPLQRSSSETEPEGEPSVAPSGDETKHELCQSAPAPPFRGVLSCSNPVTAPAASTSARGRVALLYASPLICRDPARGIIPLPQIPFEKEWDVLVQAYDEAAVSLRDDPGPKPASSNAAVRFPRPGAILSAQPLTAASLQRALAPVADAGPTSVLHLSAHGAQDCLVVEDGRGTAHFFSCEMLRGMLALRGTPPAVGGLRLVILNACSLRSAGEQLALGGVPHVICCRDQLADSASHIFLCAFYSSLFQGSTVARAFSAGIVALKSSPEHMARTAASHFCLLPESESHEEALFQRDWSLSKAASSVESFDLPWLALSRRSTSTGSRLTRTSVSSGETDMWPLDRRPSDEPTSVTSESESCGSGAQPHSSPATSACVSREETSASDSEKVTAPAPSIRPPAAVPRRGPTTAQRSRPAKVSAISSQRKVVAVPRSLQTRCEAEQSPFGRAVPQLPEDFLGRSLDVWSVLQHLSLRRAVVVCGAPNTDYGIGKTAVLDAVHRAFALQMGGVCVAVQLRSLSEPATALAADGWIQKTRSAVQSALTECRELWFPSSEASGGPRVAPRSLQGLNTLALRRRPMRKKADVRRLPVKTGFHPLSDPVALEFALEELVEDMISLSELCEARCREWPASSGRILLLLDEADHLIQQQHFQDAVADVLQRCSAFRIVLSTHQPMVGTAGGQFKVVHHALQGLSTRDSARLFLRRAPRPLRWGELDISKAGQELGQLVGLPESPVVLSKATEGQILELISMQSSIASARCNPRRLIELASRLGTSLKLLEEENYPAKRTSEPPRHQIMDTLETARTSEGSSTASNSDSTPRSVRCCLTASSSSDAPSTESETAPLLDFS